MKLQEFRDDLRFILQVGVHQDHGIASSLIECRSQSGLVAEVSGQDDDTNARIVAGGLGQQGTGRVRTAIVDEYHLVRPVWQGIEHLHEAREQLRNDLLLVIDRDAY